MREVILDTETTGLDPGEGHRVVEIGGIELVDHLPTGRAYHEYVDPERDVPPEAVEIHGITAEFLKAKPRFAEIADTFLEFIRGASLVMHNAPFDLGFLNAELERAQRPAIPFEQAVDTVLLARRKFPGAPVNLDALCKRFDIDTSRRAKHGALLDAELLSEVYLELIGAQRQADLSLERSKVGARAEQPQAAAAGEAPVRPARPHAPTPDEAAAHTAFISGLKEPIWQS